MPSDAQSDPRLIQETEYLIPYHYITLYPRIAWVYRLYDQYRAAVIQLIKSLGPGHVLEIGCGDGRLCYELMRAGLRVTGLDVSRQAVAFARAFMPQATFGIADITQQVPEGRFDLVVMMEVLEHFEPEQLATALAHVHQCLTDDGHLLVTVPSIALPVSAKHYQHFTPERLAAALHPLFRIDRVRGMLRRGLRYRLCMYLQAGDYFLGGLRRRTRLVRPYYWLLDALIAQIAYCEPAHATQLLAVCSKADLNPA